MYSECAGVPAVRIRAACCGDARVAALPELSAGARRVPPRESAPTECALAGDARRGEGRDPRHLLHRPVLAYSYSFICPTDLENCVVNSKISISNKILKTTASQGGVVARFRTLPDSDRWIEPRTLSDRTAVIFGFQFIQLNELIGEISMDHLPQG